MDLKRLLKNICAHAARGLVRLRLVPSKIIIHMDGGICSQMHFYLVGMLLSRSGHRVAYDLSWFRDVGTDLDGRMCRNFDLLRIFPGLRFEESRNTILNRIYISLFYRRNDYFGNTHDSLNGRKPLHRRILTDISVTRRKCTAGCSEKSFRSIRVFSITAVFRHCG